MITQPKFGEWIKCEDRLPETSTYVLLWNQNETRQMARLDKLRGKDGCVAVDVLKRVLGEKR